MTILRSLRELRSQPDPALAFLTGQPFDSFGSTWTASGQTVTESKALHVIAVYACISIIADAISALPLDVYEDAEDGLCVEVVAPDWIEKPSTDGTRFEFLQRVITSLLIAGDTFIFVVRDDRGSIIDLIPLSPDNVVVKQDSVGRKFFMIGQQPFSTYQILHVPAFIRPGDLTGLSPIEVARQGLGLSIAAEEYGGRFFGQGATMSGVVETPDMLTDEQARIMAKSFQAQHSGTSKAHLPGVLTGGSKWVPITVPNEQAQFLETRKFQVAEIARLYRVPPYLIGDVERSTSWGTGIEEQNRRFIEYTLQSWLVRLEAAFTSLLPSPKQFVKFNLDALLRGSTKERYEAHGVALKNGFMSVNEVRALEDLPPVEGGDVPYRELNLGPVVAGDTAPAPDPTTQGGQA